MTANESNLMIEWFITEEPEVLKKDLLKKGTVESLKHYQTSWDSLMPVYKKISDIYSEVTFGPGEMQSPLQDEWSNRIGDITCAILDVHIEDAWQEIVNFIEWYNNESNKQLNN